MNGLRAIETRYKGYRFRSRLEARFAVFLDALGVEWEYEKEGYDLGELGYYLPDFWLPVQSIWIEVKGQRPTSLEQQKAIGLCAATRHNVTIVDGLPEAERYYWGASCFVPDPGLRWMTKTPIDGGAIYSDPDAMGLEGNLGPAMEEDLDRWAQRFREWKSVLMYACEAARSARFEHGENGHPSPILDCIDVNRTRQREETELLARQARGEDVTAQLNHVRWLIRTTQETGWANP